VVDTAEEDTAVREARKLNIPVVGIVDTNCDPNLVTFPIPGNDDAIRSISLFTRVVAEAIEEGRKIKGEGADIASVEMAAPASTEAKASASLKDADAKVEPKAAAAEGAAPAAEEKPAEQN